MHYIVLCQLKVVSGVASRTRLVERPAARAEVDNQFAHDFTIIL